MSGISAISSSSIARLDHILAIPLPVPSSRASSTSDVAPPPPSSANALGAVSSEVIEVVTPAAAASSSRPSLWRRAVTLWDSYSDQEKNQAKGVAITTALWLIPGGFWKFCLGGVAAWGATEFTARVVAEKNQTANAQSQELTLAGRTKAIAIATIANGVLLRLGGIPSLIALPTSIATSYFISSHEIDPNKTPAQHLQAGQRYLETNKKKLPLQLQTALTHATPILLAATTGSLPFIAIGIGSTIAGATLPKKSEILAIEEAGLKPDPRKPLLDLASTVIQFRGSQPKNARWKGVLQPVTPPSSPQNNNPMANEIPQIPNAPGNIPREDTNYKAEADRHLKQLATYGSYWGTLYLMHTWALSLQQANPYQYTQIVREAVDNQEPLWNVFDRHIGKNLTFFQRLKAKFWYWISHSSNVSLDSAQKGLEKMSSDFRAAFTPEKQEDQAREDQLNEKVDAFLVDATNLLQEYNKATKEDAHNPVVGIDGHRRAMIQAWHGRLNELSKSFSDTIIAHWLPKHLPFFENLKNIPVFGTFLYALTSPIRWILEKISRKLIKNSIPNVIQTLITKGVEATSRRPFAIALADGLIELLTGFRDDLVKKGPKADSEIPDLPLPAIQDKLPAFVNSLIDALNLLPEKQIPQETPDQLKARVDALDKNNRPDRLQSLLSKPEKQLEQWKRNEIEKGVVKGGHMLFRYLVKNPKAVEKLFCTIARISNLPFQQNESPENDLFDSKKEGLFHIGNALFQKIVGDGVDEFLIGPPPAVVRSTLKVLFEEQQEASAQFKEIQTVAERMAEKAIDAQPQSILVDLDECAARLSEFQKKANQSKIDRVYPPIRDEIYTAFGPMYQTAHDLMEQVIQLRDTQTLLTNDQELLKHSIKIQGLFGTMLSFIEGRPPQALVDLLKNPPSEEKQKLLMQVNDYITELKNTVPTTPQPFQQALQEYVDQLKAAVQTVENGGIIQLRLNKTPPDIFSALSLLPQFRTALDQMEKILSSQPTIVPHLRSHLVQYKALLTALQKQHLLIAQIHQLDQDMVRDIPRNQYDNIKKTLSALPDQMREDLERLIGEVQRAKNEERQQRWEAAKQGLKTILLQAETAYQDEYTSLSRQIRPLQIWFQQAIRKYTQDERTHSDTLSTQLDTFGEAVDTLVAKSASTAQPNTVQRPWFEKLCRDYPSLQNLASDVAKDKAGLMRYTMDKFKRAYHLISIPRIWEGFARTAMQLVIQSYQ